MIDGAWRTRLWRIALGALFGTSLAFLLVWLASPEYVRLGRNAAAHYLELSPEPVGRKAFPTPVDPGDESAAEGPHDASPLSLQPPGLEYSAVETAVLGALAILAFGIPIPSLSIGARLRRAVARRRLVLARLRTWIGDRRASGSSPREGLRVPIAFLLTLGLFVGWLTAPDFVRHRDTSVAMPSLPGELGNELLDRYVSWIGPVSRGAVRAPDFEVLDSLPEAELSIEVFPDLELVSADVEIEARRKATKRTVRTATEDQPPLPSAAPAPVVAAGPSDEAYAMLASREWFPGPAQTVSGRGQDSAPVASRDSSSPSPERGADVGPDGPGGSTGKPGDGGPGDRNPAEDDPLVTFSSIVGEILVEFVPGANDEEIGGILSSIDGEIEECFDEVGYCLVRIPPDIEVAGLVDDLVANPAVRSALPNYVREPAQAASLDALFPLQWALRNVGQPLVGGATGADIKAPGGWAEMGAVRNRAKVGVLDTGFDLSHPDLILVAGQIYNAVDRTFILNGNPDHGTKVAGVLAGLGDNAYGIAGVNKGWADLVLVQVFDVLGRASDTDIVRGIQWLPPDTRVVNLSFTGGPPSDFLCGAIEARSSMLFVAAAGNGSGASSAVYPANCPSNNVIAVAASNQRDKLSGSSNQGGWIELAAPGEMILTTAPGSAFAFASGTSVAAPHVSGAASMIFAKEPWLSAEAVRQRILGTVDKKGLNVETGGRLNACRALGGSSC